jgi:hypothetical protein
MGRKENLLPYARENSDVQISQQYQVFWPIYL